MDTGAVRMLMSDVRLRVLVVAGVWLWNGCDEEVSSGEARRDAGGSVEAGASEVVEVTGSVRPLYFVGRVVYAAPASKFQPCPAISSVEDVGGSSVEYLGGSTLGTVLSADESFVEPDVVQVRAPESLRLRQFYWLATDGRGIDIAKPQGFPVLRIPADLIARSAGIRSPIPLIRSPGRSAATVWMGGQAVV
jgi:hypothetical protein